MKIIRQFATEAPRTFAITVGWLLFLGGMFVWAVVRDGIWWALGGLAIAVVLGGALHLLNRWAAKGDGIDEPEPKVVIRIDGDDVPLSESQLRAYQAWLERGGADR